METLFLIPEPLTCYLSLLFMNMLEAKMQQSIQQVIDQLLTLFIAPGFENSNHIHHYEPR